MQGRSLGRDPALFENAAAASTLLPLHHRTTCEQPLSLSLSKSTTFTEPSLLFRRVASAITSPLDDSASGSVGRSPRDALTNNSPATSPRSFHHKQPTSTSTVLPAPWPTSTLTTAISATTTVRHHLHQLHLSSAARPKTVVAVKQQVEAAV